MDQKPAVGRQVFRVKEIDARCVDANQPHPELMKLIDETGLERGEVFSEMVRVGISASAQQDPLVRDGGLQILQTDSRSGSGRDANHLAGSQKVVKRPGVDTPDASAIMTGPVGMRT